MAATETRARELASRVADYLATDPARRTPLCRSDLEDIAAILDGYAGGFTGLTPLAVNCLQIIQEMIEANGYPPSVEELRRELDLAAKSGVCRLLYQLEARGYIERVHGHARALRVLRRVPMPDLTDRPMILQPASAPTFAEASAGKEASAGRPAPADEPADGTA